MHQLPRRLGHGHQPLVDVQQPGHHTPMPGRRVLIAATFAIAAAGCTRDVPRSDAEVILPAELADDDALAAMNDWLALPSLGPGRYLQQSSADRATGEPVEIPLWDHGNRDFNNFVCRGAQAV